MQELVHGEPGEGLGRRRVKREDVVLRKVPVDDVQTSMLLGEIALVSGYAMNSLRLHIGSETMLTVTMTTRSWSNARFVTGISMSSRRVIPDQMASPRVIRSKSRTR